MGNTQQGPQLIDLSMRFRGRKTGESGQFDAGFSEFLVSIVERFPMTSNLIFPEIVCMDSARVLWHNGQAEEGESRFETQTGAVLLLHSSIR
jgi:hypothetical protein